MTMSIPTHLGIVACASGGYRRFYKSFLVAKLILKYIDITQPLVLY